MTKLKVLYFIDGLGRGGAQRHLVSLLSHLDPMQFEPHVWCLEKKGDLVAEVERLGIPTFDLGFENEKIVSLKAILALPTLRRHLRHWQPHILHTYLFSANLYGTVLGTLARVPVRLSSRRDMAWWEGRRHLYATQLCNHFVDKVVAVCESVRQLTIAREGLAPDHIVTVPNGIELDDFDRDSERDWIGPELQVGSGPLLAMTAGLRPVKGHEYLLQALHLIKPSYPQLRCLLVGDGPRREELVKLSRELGLEQNVVFLGWQANVAALLNRVDIFLLCSTSEGFSNALLEAMAASRPVIATDVGGNKEVVVNGTTGLLVPPRDPEGLAKALDALLVDRNRASAMGKCGRLRVQQLFTANVMAKRVESLYVELMKSA